MVDCIIGSREAILKISAHGRWDEGVISAITLHQGYTVDQNLSNVNVVLYRRHCVICPTDFLFFILIEAKKNQNFFA